MPTLVARPAPRTRLFDRSFDCRVEHFAHYTPCVHGMLPHTLPVTHCTPVVNLKFKSKLNLEGLYQLVLIVRSTALDGDSWLAAIGGWCCDCWAGTRIGAGTIPPDVEHTVHILQCTQLLS